MGLVAVGAAKPLCLAHVLMEDKDLQCSDVLINCLLVFGDNVVRTSV